MSIGNFDGVHLGHQALIARVRERAGAAARQSLVITFWPHPRQVLAPHQAPPLLSTREDRLEILAQLGVDAVLELPFDRRFSELSPEEFVLRVLVPVRCRELIIGHDFSLGRGRSGTLEVLRALGERHAFTVEQIPPVLVDGRVISTSRIRSALRAGQVRYIPALLGRWHSLCAPLCTGFGRGTQLGIPTLNMRPQGTMLPRNGVYASFVRINGQVWPAVTNVGNTPTFHNEHLTVESHVLDASPTPDATPPTVYFVQRLRDERRFADSEALVTQIHTDIAAARNVLSTAAPPAN